MTAVALGAVCSLATAGAAAQDSSFCRKVRARAASDADLLMSPRVVLQGIHFPAGGQQVDSGPVAGSGFQVRAGLSFSPLDYYKGTAVLRVGDADCDRQEASDRMRDELAHALDRARASALRDEARFLRARSEDWRAVSARAAARLGVRIITLVEFTSMQHLADALEHKLVQAEGEASELDARRSPIAPGALSLRAMSAEYLRQSMRFEREASHLRLLDAWSFRLTGGVIPQPPVDWYGVAELTFSLADVVRGRHEEAYVGARADELRDGPEELDAQVDAFHSQAQAALERARRDLEVVEHSLEVLRDTRSILGTAETETVAQARDTLTLEQTSIESDGVFLRGFIDALAARASD